MHANWNIFYPYCDWSSRDIEHPFYEKEIRDAVFGLGAKKSQGPDGFPIIFFQIFWDIIKPDLLSLFGHLYSGTMDFRCLNYVLVALILKKVFPWLIISDPLVTKVLTNQLRFHIHLPINQVQSAFTKNNLFLTV